MSKIKQLSSQEWAILILFIISIITLIATVEWTGKGNENQSYVNEMEEKTENVLTYNWSNEQ